MSVCTLLTDFGWRDWYVGALKGTLLRLSPGVSIHDLSHDVEPGDIEAAAFLLGAAAPTFPAGTLHLAVVDPGVGSARRMLAARARAHTFVAPDNGLLTRVLDEGATVHAVDRPDLYLEAPGQTFHGRDRFAPIAAAILGGAALSSLGPRVDDAIRGGWPPPRRDLDARLLRGHVVHVDRFGNLITDIPAVWIDGQAAVARIGAVTVSRRATHYAELPPGVLALLPGSVGTVEIALRQESAAAATRVARGEPVVIELGSRTS
jgi:S-adenosylmethionine hydrolase